MNDNFQDYNFKIGGAHPESLVWILGGFIFLVTGIVFTVPLSNQSTKTLIGILLIGLGASVCFYGFKRMFSGRLILSESGLKYGDIFIAWSEIKDSRSFSKQVGSVKRMNLLGVSLELKAPDKVLNKLSLLSRWQQTAWFGTQVSDGFNQSDLGRSQEFYIPLTHSPIDPEELNKIICLFLNRNAKSNGN